MRSLSSSGTADKRLFGLSLLIFIVTCIGGFAALRSRDPSTSITPPPATVQPLTASGTIAANLTRLPQSAPLTGQLATDLNEVEALINACPDYTDARRTQIAKHLAWLRDPSMLTQEMIIALGSNPTEGLLRGLATYTLSDWGLKNQDGASCLLPIGQRLNVLLVAAGGSSIEAFEEISE